MTRGVSMLAWLLLVSCGGGGPRKPGALAGQTYFWQVSSSAIEFGTCSDDPGFRKDLVPLTFQTNSYLIYKVEKDAKTATSQTCTDLDPATCKASTTGVVFTVAGPELIYETQGKSALFDGGCQLEDTTTQTLTDQGPTGTFEIAHVLTLTDNPTACAAAEQQIKAQSPNMTGLEGCVVTFKIGLTLK